MSCGSADGSSKFDVAVVRGYHERTFKSHAKTVFVTLSPEQTRYDMERKAVSYRMYDALVFLFVLGIPCV